MRVIVDMSATILHHGHIRLLKKAKELGLKVNEYEFVKQMFHALDLYRSANMSDSTT